MTPDLGLLLAIACRGETDARDLDECRAMWSVTYAQAERRGVTVERQARAYYSILKRDKNGRHIVRTDRAMRIRALARDGATGQWAGVLAAADAFVADPRRTCDADHFGADCTDDVGACDEAPPHWVRVTCGEDFRQAYWRTGQRTLPASVAAGG